MTNKDSHLYFRFISRFCTIQTKQGWYDLEELPLASVIELDGIEFDLILFGLGNLYGSHKKMASTASGDGTVWSQ